MRITLALATALILGSCAAPPPPQPAPRPLPPRPTPLPVPAPPPLSSDWRDWPITPGTWTLRNDAGGTVALFGTPGAAATFALRCDRQANAVHLSRAGVAGATGLTIRTSTATRALPARPTGATAETTATLPSGDRLLDAIGFSRGRFVIEAPPLAALVIPAWPEILRVVEDCRG